MTSSLPFPTQDITATEACPKSSMGSSTSSAVAAESTRMTPVSSMQYAAVPVFNVTGPALTEKPVSPEASASCRNTRGQG